MTIGCDKCVGLACQCRKTKAIKQRTQLIGDDERINAELAHSITMQRLRKQQAEPSTLTETQAIEIWACNTPTHK